LRRFRLRAQVPMPSEGVVAEAARAAAEATSAARVGGGAEEGMIAAAAAEAEAKVSTELAAEEHGAPEVPAERLRVAVPPPRNAASWWCWDPA